MSKQIKGKCADVIIDFVKNGRKKSKYEAKILVQEERSYVRQERKMFIIYV